MRQNDPWSGGGGGGGNSPEIKSAFLYYESNILQSRVPQSISLTYSFSKNCVQWISNFYCGCMIDYFSLLINEDKTTK